MSFCPSVMHVLVYNTFSSRCQSNVVYPWRRTCSSSGRNIFQLLAGQPLKNPCIKSSNGFCTDLLNTKLTHKSTYSFLQQIPNKHWWWFSKRRIMENFIIYSFIPYDLLCCTDSVFTETSCHWQLLIH